jgi:hypothetical protein
MRHRNLNHEDFSLAAIMPISQKQPPAAGAYSKASVPAQ